MKNMIYMEKSIKKNKYLLVMEYFSPHIMGGAEISGQIMYDIFKKTKLIHILTPNYDKFKLSIKNNIIKYPSFRYFLYKNKTKSTKLRQKNKKIFSKLQNVFFIISAIEMSIWIFFIKIIYNKNIIHGNNFESNLAVLLSPVNSKKYIHLRDTIFFDKKRSLLRKLIKTLFKWQSNKYFCISEYIKKQYIKILKDKKNKYIIRYNNTDKTQISDLNKYESRKILKLPENKNIILYVGSLTEEKGIDYVFENLINKFPSSLFLICGDGYLKEKLTKYKKKYNNFILKGNIKNEKLKYYYKASDITIVPSKWNEPYGRVSIESQINQTYTIVSDKGGLPETIISKKTGICTKLHNFEKIIKLKLKKF
jgi:glycosyltransferase involved in cell wall biosynthesis